MDTKNWKEFRVGDLFTPYLGGNPSSSKISDFGKYAIITASSDNNGISGYTDCYQEGLVFSNIITLGNRGSYNAFYHPYDVYLGNNVLALEEKFEMTENQKLFITTLINKFHYDGYKRTGRGLRKIGNPDKKYKDVIDVYKYADDTKGIDFVEDYITLNGNDWNYDQHRIIDTTPIEEDFLKTVGDFLQFEISRIMI